MRNERFVTFIDGPSGFCAVVMVAAVGVGHVTAAYDPDVATHGAAFARAGVSSRVYDVPRPIGKGDEVGTFHLGSTAIALFQPGRVQLDAIVPGTPTRMGQTVGRLVSSRADARTEVG